MEPKEICRMALDRWGQMQIVMVFEETAELNKELSKWLRRKGNHAAIIEEIADVQIVLDQMKLKFGEAQVEMVKKAKLAKLEELLRCP